MYSVCDSSRNIGLSVSAATPTAFIKQCYIFVTGRVTICLISLQCACLIFPGVGAVGAMEILHEFSGERLEGLKKFK